MNTDPNCGCNQTKSGSDSREYLMVKTTASEASTCSGPSAESGVGACPRQEPAYDVSMSDFLVPTFGGSTVMEVCNPTIYTLNMWLQFTSPVALLQIINITGNILTLSNKCPNGEEILDNIVSTVIPKGTPFVVGNAPQCNTDAEDQERINSAFSQATELCIPNLETSKSTTTIRPIGKIESDSADGSIRHCIKAIYGILFKAGTPVLTALARKLPTDINYRRLGKHKTTNEVVQLDNYSETPDLSGQSYGLMINNSTERVVPTYFMVFRRDVMIAGASGDNFATDWDDMPASLKIEQSFDLPLDDLFNQRDHIYVMVKVDLGIHSQAAGNKSLAVYLNDLYRGKVVMNGTSDHASTTINTISAPVKIFKSDYKLKIRVESNVVFKYYLRAVRDETFY